jgi:hypothetical protein
MLLSGAGLTNAVDLFKIRRIRGKLNLKLVNLLFIYLKFLKKIIKICKKTRWNSKITSEENFSNQ